MSSNKPGVTLAASASATNFSTLAAARFFMGIFESCLNPGFVLITSSWWKREEQTARVGIWYSANGIMGAPSGLLFWGLAHIQASSPQHNVQDDSTNSIGIGQKNVSLSMDVSYSRAVYRSFRHFSLVDPTRLTNLGQFLGRT